MNKVTAAVLGLNLVAWFFGLGFWLGKREHTPEDRRAYIACYPDGNFYAEHFIAEGVTFDEFENMLRKLCWSKAKVRDL